MDPLEPPMATIIFLVSNCKDFLKRTVTDINGSQSL